MPLHLAVGNGMCFIVRALIKYGADVNTRNPETGETAVSLAEKIGNQEVIDLCVSTAAHTNRP